MLDNVRLHPAFEVSGVWDPSPQAVAKTRELMPDAPVAPSAEAAMQGADVVYLACPPGPRKAYALAAAAAGQGVFMEKPLGTDNAASRDLVAQLRSARLPGVVNFTQSSSRGFEELKRAIATGETGELLGIDIVVQYPAWPRAWQAEADWLRFRAEGGYTREVISHFLFLAGRFLGPLQLRQAAPRYPADPALCELDLLARLETADGRPAQPPVPRVLPAVALGRRALGRGRGLEHGRRPAAQRAAAPAHARRPVAARPTPPAGHGRRSAGGAGVGGSDAGRPHLKQPPPRAGRTPSRKP
jgi:hypothetical protein